MKDSTKTFIGGLVIGTVIGILGTIAIYGTIVLNALTSTPTIHNAIVSTIKK